MFCPSSAEEPIFKVAIPTGGPKVTSMIWSGLDDLLLTGHDNGDLVQWDVKTQKKLKLTSGICNARKTVFLFKECYPLRSFQDYHGHAG